MTANPQRMVDGRRRRVAPVTPEQERAARANEQLTVALVEMATHGQYPACTDPVTRGAWTSEDPLDRRLAATWCAGCAAQSQCQAAAEAQRETFGVWAGVDRSPRRPGPRPRTTTVDEPPARPTDPNSRRSTMSHTYTAEQPDDSAGRRARWKAQHGGSRDSTAFDRFWTGKQPSDPDETDPADTGGNVVPSEGDNPPRAEYQESLREVARRLFSPDSSA